MAKDFVLNYLQAVAEPLPELKQSFDAELGLLKEHCSVRSSVLDVGCRAAIPALHLAPHVKELVGVDKSPKMIEQALERCGHLQNARFVIDDPLNLSFTSKTFDVSFCTYNVIGTHKKSERQRLVNEMTRVTRPFGKVINISWKQDKKTTDFLKKYYPSIGIKIFEIDESKSITSKGTFDRLAKKEMAAYYKTAGLEQVEFVDVGPVWHAAIGIKPKGQFDDWV